MSASSEPSPKSASAATTHERLLEVAMELFAERGYLGASMKDIAVRVGVRKPSLYNYYRSKDELFLALLDRSLETWREASQLREEGPLSERMREHLKSAVEFAVKNPHPVAICRLAVSQIHGELEPRVARRLQAEQERYVAEVEAQIEQAIERGEVAAGSTRAKVLAWTAFMDGIFFHLAFKSSDSAEIYDRLDGLWDVFWQGLAAR